MLENRTRAGQSKIRSKELVLVLHLRHSFGGNVVVLVLYTAEDSAIVSITANVD